MVYKLGVVGLGHWFEMLHVGMLSDQKVRLKKVAGVRSFNEKKESLENLGISRSDYYQVGKNPNILPKKFLEDIDMVQISDPNKYHFAQTKQALEKDLYVITEKTWATNKKDFYEFIDFLKSNRYTDKAYLHLHYVHKLLTIKLPSILAMITPKHGRIEKFSATFFEEANEADRMRSGWIFGMESGGIFMDWIHPYEILFIGAKASEVRLHKANNFLVNQDYDKNNPTGVEAFVSAKGLNFAPDAKGVIRIGKGLPHNTGLKRFIFLFESGAKLYLNFVGSQIEYNSDNRGNWQFVKENEKSCKILSAEIPKGPLTSSMLMEDINKLLGGKGPSLKINDVIKIFGPQWEYQEKARKQGVIADRGNIERFIHEGISSNM